MFREEFVIDFKDLPKYLTIPVPWLWRTISGFNLRVICVGTLLERFSPVIYQLVLHQSFIPIQFQRLI
jgi:hypothetical protein